MCLVVLAIQQAWKIGQVSPDILSSDVGQILKIHNPLLSDLCITVDISHIHVLLHNCVEPRVCSLITCGRKPHGIGCKPQLLNLTGSSSGVVLMTSW